jgi:hypothetical protein
MQLRRAVKQTLRVRGSADEADTDYTAAEVAAVGTAGRRKRFRKWPDTPLGLVLGRKQDPRAG